MPLVNPSIPGMNWPWAVANVAAGATQFLPRFNDVTVPLGIVSIGPRTITGLSAVLSLAAAGAAIDIEIFVGAPDGSAPSATGIIATIAIGQVSVVLGCNLPIASGQIVYIQYRTPAGWTSVTADLAVGVSM